MASHHIKHIQALLSKKNLHLKRYFGSYDLRPYSDVQGIYTRPDNKTFWTASEELQLWDAKTGKQIRRVDLCADFASAHSDGLWLISGRSLYHHTKTTRHVRELPPSIHSASFDRAHNNVLVTTKDNISIASTSGARSQGFARKGDFDAVLSPDGARVIVAQRGVLSALTPDGNALWSAPLSSADASLAFVDDLIAVSDDKTLRCLSGLDGVEQWQVTLSAKPLMKLSCSQYKIAVTDGETIFIVDLRGQLVASLPGKSPFALSPDSSWLVLAEGRQQIKIFDLPSGKERFLGAGHSSPITSITWRNKEEVASIARGEIRCWNIISGEQEHTLELPGVQVGRSAPDGQSLFVFSDGAVQQKSFDGETLASYAVEGQTLRSFLLSRGGSFLVTMSSDHLHGWRIGERAPLWSMRAPQSITSLNALFDESHFWILTRESLLQFDTSSGEQKRKGIVRYEHTLESAVILEDGESAVGLLSTMYSDGYGYSYTIQRWDIDSQRVLWSKYAGPSLKLGASDHSRWGLYKTDEQITFFDLKTGAEIQSISLRPLHDHVQSLAFSPDERHMAIGTRRGIVLLFSLEEALSPDR